MLCVIRVFITCATFCEYSCERGYGKKVHGGKGSRIERYYFYVKRGCGFVFPIFVRGSKIMCVLLND